MNNEVVSILGARASTRPATAGVAEEVTRPLIEIAPCDHPLYHDYSAGVTIERAWQLYHASDRTGGT